MWHLTGYAEDLPAHAPDDVTVALRRDGTVDGGGTWWADGSVLEIRDVPVETFDGTTQLRSWRLLVDDDLALGRDDRTATVRAERIGSAPPVVAAPAPSPAAGPIDNVTTAPVAPRFTG